MTRLLAATALVALGGTASLAAVSSARARTAPAARPQRAELAFDVASVKPSDPSLVAPGDADFPACAGGPINVNPGRFSAGNTTLYTLVTLAYGVRYSCFIVNDSSLVSGGPRWVLSDRFDVQASIPAGTPFYTVQQLRSGTAPQLQSMLQSLLAERFQLAVHRISKPMRVYVLTSASPVLKLAPPDDTKPARSTLSLEPDENREIIVHVVGNKASIEDLVHLLEPVTHTPVIDRTGLKGEYSFDVKFAVIEPFSGPLANLVGATSPTIFSVLQERLGLRLEQTRAPVDGWVIDRAERPSIN